MEASGIIDGSFSAWNVCCASASPLRRADLADEARMLDCDKIAEDLVTYRVHREHIDVHVVKVVELFKEFALGQDGLVAVERWRRPRLMLVMEAEIGLGLLVRPQDGLDLVAWKEMFA